MATEVTLVSEQKWEQVADLAEQVQGVRRLVNHMKL
jgi:osmotically-inducible protein OsmY